MSAHHSFQIQPRPVGYSTTIRANVGHRTWTHNTTLRTLTKAGAQRKVRRTLQRWEHNQRRTITYTAPVTRPTHLYDQIVTTLITAVALATAIVVGVWVFLYKAINGESPAAVAIVGAGTLLAACAVPATCRTIEHTYDNWKHHK